MKGNGTIITTPTWEKPAIARVIKSIPRKFANPAQLSTQQRNLPLSCNAFKKLLVFAEVFNYYFL